MKQYLSMLIQNIPTRQTTKQKDNFLRITSALLQSKNIPVHIVTIKEKHIQARYLVAGAKNAETVFLCPYDTGKRMLVPHGWFYPGDDELNHHTEEKNLLLYFLLCIIGIALVFICGILFRKGLYLIGFLCIIPALLCIYESVRTPSVKVNMNRSNAACALAYKLVSETPDKIAVIFCDAAVETGTGYRLLQQEYNDELKKRNLIFLDALADGNDICLIGNTSFKSAAYKLMMKYLPCPHNSRLSSFPHACMIASGEIKNDKLVCIHSRNRYDCHIKIDQLESLADKMTDYLYNVIHT